MLYVQYIRICICTVHNIICVYVYVCVNCKEHYSLDIRTKNNSLSIHMQLPTVYSTVCVCCSLFLRLVIMCVHSCLIVICNGIGWCWQVIPILYINHCVYCCLLLLAMSLAPDPFLKTRRIWSSEQYGLMNTCQENLGVRTTSNQPKLSRLL